MCNTPSSAYRKRKRSDILKASHQFLLKIPPPRTRYGSTTGIPIHISQPKPFDMGFQQTHDIPWLRWHDGLISRVFLCAEVRKMKPATDVSSTNRSRASTSTAPWTGLRPGPPELFNGVGFPNWSWQWNSMGQAVENTQNTQLNRLNHRQQIWPLSSPSRTLPVLGAKNLKTSALGSNMFLTRLLLPMLDWHQSLIQQNSKAVRNFCDCL